MCVCNIVSHYTFKKYFITNMYTYIELFYKKKKYYQKDIFVFF